MREVASPRNNGANKLHLQQNEPGMMTANNDVFSENSVNIAGPYLQINQQIDYVVNDVDAGHSGVALELLPKKGSLRCHIPH